VSGGRTREPKGVTACKDVGSRVRSLSHSCVFIVAASSCMWPGYAAVKYTAEILRSAQNDIHSLCALCVSVVQMLFLG